VGALREFRAAVVPGLRHSIGARHALVDRSCRDGVAVGRAAVDCHARR
jgi:hypothetical protein